MEHYDAKDLTLALFRELLSEDEFADVAAGIVIQAYLRDSRDDLADLIAWSSGRATPITVRLVKGAYWDTGSGAALARAGLHPQSRPDAQFERMTRLPGHCDTYARVGHGIRSMAQRSPPCGGRVA
jgi:RHH-type proline utilization regulon transcriptional repressor/proline dehydrogenase/delta 1-pyrroline-5-carboxylate dehydrogenase